MNRARRQPTRELILLGAGELARSRWFLTAVVAIGAILVGWAWWIELLADRTATAEAFDREASRATHVIENRVAIALELVYGGRGLFFASKTVDRDAWRAYVDNLELGVRHPDTTALGFIRHVTAAEKPAFEQSIAPFSPGGIYPVGTGGEHFVVDFVEPTIAQGAIGFDVLSDPVQGEVLHGAWGKTALVTTPALRLPTDIDPRPDPAILVLLPVNPPGAGEGLGFVYAALHVRDLVTTEAVGSGQKLLVEVFDLGFDKTERVAVWRDPDYEQALPRLRSNQVIEVGGRTWEIVFATRESPLVGTWRPWLVPVIGASVVALIVGLLWSVSTSRDRAFALAASMTYDLRERESQLAVARDQALAASRAKGEFLASVSHEIRTPLNAILGTAELLARTTLNPEQRRFVEVCRKAGDHLLALLNNVLDLSKVEAGQIQIEQVDFDLDEVAAQCVDIVAPRARNQRIDLVWRVDPSLPRVWLGDPHRVRQVVINLLGNAVKFTHEGGISLEIEPTLDRRYVRFAVTDTGIGIPKEKLADVFREFTQVDASTTRNYGGTGLGLAISKRLVDRMGGRIEVVSQIGAGSRFWFDLPLRASARQPTSDGLRELDGIRIASLVANRVARQVVNETLDRAGAVVASLADLAAAERLAQDRSDTVMVLANKWLLPDPIGALGRLRTLGHEGPIVLLTDADGALEMAEIRRLSLDVLEQPFRPWMLVDAVSRLVHGIDDPTVEPPERAEALTVGGVRRVLVAEDNEDNRMIVEAFLRGEPYHVEFAEDGHEAVAKATEAAWSLILMDMQMPGLDGAAATREIRRWEEAASRPRTPIIALTAHAFAQERSEMMAAGCDDVMSKPIRRDTLLSALALWAKSKFSLPNIEEAQPPGPAPGCIPVRPPAALAGLARNYLDKRGVELDHLVALASASNLDEVARIAHQIKGSGGSFGFTGLTEIGADLEQAAKAANLVAVGRCLADLGSYLKRVELVNA